MSTPPDSEPLPYAVRLTPRAQRQLGSLPEGVSQMVQARLNRLAAHRRAGANRARVVQGHLLGKDYRALYEVDHDEGVVTVLDVESRG